MKLYVFPFAPNPAKVLLYAAEKGLADLERVVVNLVAGEQKSPAHRARHPQGKLPVLELDDGQYLTESLAIIEYLEEIYPEPPLIGRTPEERAFVRARERAVDIGVLMAGGRCVHATNSPLGLPPNPPVAADARASLERALQQVDGWLAASAFVAGPAFTVADCTLWGALRFQSALGLEPDPGLSSLKRWREQLASRPSVQQLEALPAGR